MLAEPKIDIANFNDLDEILEIWAMGLNFDHIVSIDRQRITNKFIENFKAKQFPYEFWIVRNNHKILSFCSILPVFQNPLKYDTYGELSIYGRSHWQTMGYNRHLINHVVKELRESNIKTLIGMIPQDNMKSIRLAERLNWVKCGSIDKKQIFSIEI